MSPLVRAALLEIVVRDYQQLAARRRPPYLWVREYDSPHSYKPHSGFRAMTWANRVWLLSEAGLQERSVLDWRRFEVIHCQNFRLPSNPIWTRGVHEIGLAAFGSTQEAEVFYLENIYGGLFGSGWTLKVDASGIRERKMAWIS